MNIVVFIRLYGFYRRGGNPRAESVRRALRAFNKEFN
jgi:hypothetical protein